MKSGRDIRQVLSEKTVNNNASKDFLKWLWIALGLTVIIIHSFELASAENPEDLAVSVTVSPTEIISGDKAIVNVIISNAGNNSSTITDVILESPPDWKPAKQLNKPLSSISPNGNSLSIFEITVPEDYPPGVYSIIVTAQSSTLSVSGSSTITVKSFSWWDPIILIINTFIPFFFTGIVGGALAYYWGQKAKQKENYINALKSVEELAFDYYIPISSYADSFGKSFNKKNNPEYTFFLLAKFFVKRLEWIIKEGGVLKLNNYGDELIANELYRKGRDNLDFLGPDDIAYIQSYVTMEMNFYDFINELKINVRLRNIYQKFENCANCKKIEEAALYFECYSYIVMYSVNMMFEHWYVKPFYRKNWGWWPDRWKATPPKQKDNERLEETITKIRNEMKLSW